MRNWSTQNHRPVVALKPMSLLNEFCYFYILSCLRYKHVIYYVKSLCSSQLLKSFSLRLSQLWHKEKKNSLFLRKLRRARAPASIMCTFYRGTIESILTSCITVWYGACNASCRKTLQRIVRAAEKIIGVSLPSLQDIYSTCLTRKALCIAGDPTHPTHSFFSLLPSGRRLRSLQARTSGLKDSFIHQAVRKLNSLPSLPLLSFTPRTTELWHYDPPPQLPTSPGPSTPPPTYKLWPAPVTLCSIGLITTSSSIDCKLPLLTVWLKTVLWALITLTDW